MIKSHTAEYGVRWKKRTANSAKLCLAGFEEDLAARRVLRVVDITDAVISAWIADRQKGGGGLAKWQNSTINRTLSAARKCFRWAARERKPALCRECAAATVRLLKETKRSRDEVIPSPAEWRRLVETMATMEGEGSTDKRRAHDRENLRGLALLLAIAVQTGERIDELRHMRAEDIGADVIRVRAWGGWSPKDHEERDIAVPESTAKLAREFVAWRTSATGNGGKRLALGEHWIADRIARAWEAAKLPGDAPGCHDARRTCATEMHRQGFPMLEIRNRLGHADIETTEGYLGRYRGDTVRTTVDFGVAGALVRGE